MVRKSAPQRVETAVVGGGFGGLTTAHRPAGGHPRATERVHTQQYDTPAACTDPPQPGGPAERGCQYERHATGARTGRRATLCERGYQSDTSAVRALSR